MSLAEYALLFTPPKWTTVVLFAPWLLFVQMMGCSSVHVVRNISHPRLTEHIVGIA
jgi:hypothetical protein